MAESGSGLPLFLEHLLGWYAMTVLALGRKTGLLDALMAGPGTATEIAARAGADERNTLAWLRAMLAAGHVTHAGGTFELAPQSAAILGGAFPVDATAVIDFAGRAGDLLDEVAEAMKTGRGVPPERYHAVFGEFMGRVNTPTYRAVLVGDWIAGVPGLGERLADGARVADLACGDGAAVRLLARAFPGAHVMGFDTDRGAIHAARRLAAAEGIANASYEAAGIEEMSAHGPFTLVTCLDSWHHLGDTPAVAASVREALTPDGVLLVVESAYSGDADADAASPTALIGYAAGLLYCLQESLAGGGEGLTPADGPGWVQDGLEKAGFTRVEQRVTRGGWRVFTAEG